MGRRLWANLIYSGSNYFFTLNEEVGGEPTLLLLLPKGEQETLISFLLRCKTKALKQLKMAVDQVSLLVDFDRWGRVWTGGEEEGCAGAKFHSKVKLFSEGFDSETPNTPSIHVASSLLQEIEEGLRASKIELAAVEFSGSVLATYLTRTSQHTPLLHLHTQGGALSLTKYQGSRMAATSSVPLDWEGMLERLRKRLKLPQGQIELFLLSGVDLGTLTQLHPHIEASVCIWHLKRLLGRALKSLFQTVKTGGVERVVVTGPLGGIGGFGGYLNRQTAGAFGVETDLSGTTPLVLFLNRAFNYGLWREGWLGQFCYNTDVIEIRLRRSNRIISRLSWFLNLRTTKLG